MNNPARKTFKLTSAEAIAAAAQWERDLDTMKAQRKALQEETAMRNQIILQSFSEKCRRHWRVIASTLGVDPDKTWNTSEWGVDFQYLAEHGEAYAYYEPVPTSPNEEANMPFPPPLSSTRMH